MGSDKIESINPKMAKLESVPGVVKIELDRKLVPNLKSFFAQTFKKDPELLPDGNQLATNKYERKCIDKSSFIHKCLKCNFKNTHMERNAHIGAISA